MSKGKSSNGTSQLHSSTRSQSRRTRFAICSIIFLLAFGVRVLSWHDTRLEVGKVQTTVSGDYKRVAQLLRQGGVASFFSSSSPLGDLNTLGHPPGYSILIAAVYSIFGESDTAVQFAQMIGDALAAVMIFLIVAELLPAMISESDGVFDLSAIERQPRLGVQLRRAALLSSAREDERNQQQSNRARFQGDGSPFTALDGTVPPPQSSQPRSKRIMSSRFMPSETRISPKKIRPNPSISIE